MPGDEFLQILNIKEKRARFRYKSDNIVTSLNREPELIP